MSEMLRQAYIQANKVYEEAITSREKLDRLCASVPIDDQELYVHMIRIQEMCVQVINAAWDAKDALDRLHTLHA